MTTRSNSELTWLLLVGLNESSNDFSNFASVARLHKAVGAKTGG